MKAMIFAAGIGSRLKPFTDSHPKALVSVGGKPMLRRVIEKIKDAGISEITINVHHFANQIIEYLNENNNFDVDISISNESNLLLDTGGGIIAAERYLNGTDYVLLHNADILTDFRIKDMIDTHINSGNDATLLVANRKTSRYLLFDDTQRMCGWINTKTNEIKPTGIASDKYDMLAFGGVHIISKSILDELNKYATDNNLTNVPFSIMKFYINACNKLKLGAYFQPEGSKWFDVGRPETLNAAEIALSAR
jgi:NDP-sugar pyrophosphorylase family protein